MHSERGSALVIVGIVVTTIVVLSGAFLALTRLRSAETSQTLTPRAVQPTAVYTLPTIPVSSESGRLKDLVGGGTVVTPGVSPQITFGPSGALDFFTPTLSSVLSVDKKSVTLTFNILDNVRNVTYSVTYPTAGGDKGANGSFNVPQPWTVTTREVKLGTCSSGGNCTYDTVTGSIAVRAVFTPIFGAATEITITTAY